MAAAATFSVALQGYERILSKTWYDCGPFMEHLFMLFNNQIHILSMFMRVRCLPLFACHLADRGKKKEEETMTTTIAMIKVSQDSIPFFICEGAAFGCCCCSIINTVRWSSVACFVLWTNEWYVGFGWGFSISAVQLSYMFLNVQYDYVGWMVRWTLVYDTYVLIAKLFHTTM